MRREEAAIDSIRPGLMIFQKMGSGMEYSQLMSLLAEAYGKNDQPAKGLAVIADALAFDEAGGECYYKAELLRLQGELRLAEGADASEAEACFRQAVDVARGQAAKMWELRATLSLSRLLRQQGKSPEAYDELGKVYDWFTEGFNTIDLQEAKKFLDNRT